MEPISLGLGAVLSAIFGAIGNIASGGFQANAANKATKSAAQSKQMEIDWLRESAEMEQRAQEEENARRTAEAQHRAAKLEDVVGMFQGLDFGEGGSYMNRLDQMAASGGNLTANTGPLSGMANKLAGMNFDDLRGIADILMSDDDRVNLRKAAMYELEKNSGMLNSMLAQSGVFGSGFGAGQQRGLATDTMMGLARDISTNRYNNLVGAGNLRQGAHQLDVGARSAAGQLYGTAADLNLRAGMANQDWTRSFASLLPQLGQLELGRLQGISDLYRDDAFGANLPYEPTKVV